MLRVKELELQFPIFSTCVLPVSGLWTQEHSEEPNPRALSLLISQGGGGGWGDYSAERQTVISEQQVYIIAISDVQVEEVRVEYVVDTVISTPVGARQADEVFNEPLKALHHYRSQC